MPERCALPCRWCSRRCRGLLRRRLASSAPSCFARLAPGTLMCHISRLRGQGGRGERKRTGDEPWSFNSRSPGFLEPVRPQRRSEKKVKFPESQPVPTAQLRGTRYRCSTCLFTTAVPALPFLLLRSPTNHGHHFRRRLSKIKAFLRRVVFFHVSLKSLKE